MPNVTQMVKSVKLGSTSHGSSPWGSDQRHLGTLVGSAKHTKAQGGRVARSSYRAGEGRWVEE